jgi:hypothetical protein
MANNHELSTEEKRLSAEAAKRLGISRVLLFRDGDWICDPRDRVRDLKMGFGSSAEAAVKDCADENGIALD